ncbi:DUF4436 domain-containing protein [Mycolicibacterium moriokaense]|uniref:DUF4436 domain-containing protein n=1 Tax=Mycolicibacterium moriokaense TaxID=39691 RepID=A0AAD1M450_9MYCO|nr:DUF4436 domain-containing protein [Mycolicibacterium moriokaense]MCV7037705.1 DUF4436 domain-containing protein [Mycolicibacterium moriokaense]BBW99355.1 DUF4436 domain-containing protein [Mycolicibacterium moriokaense]
MPVDAPPKPNSDVRGRLASFGTVLIIIVVYAAALAGYHYVAGPAESLPPPDIGESGDTVVVVDLEELRTVETQLDVDVMVYPADKYMNPALNVVNTNVAVRLFVDEVSIGGDLETPAGSLPQEISTTLETYGDPESWPFDDYTIGPVRADVIVGSGDDRKFQPARVEVTGNLNSWDISTTRSGPSTQSSGEGDYQTIHLSRARGPLAFDVGLCLVLVTLPAIALFLSIEMIRGRKQFMPPFGTWYAASLFAIIPIRSFMPGAPPPGAWIDQILVLWVLVALTAAMVVYFVAWHRRCN